MPELTEAERAEIAEWNRQRDELFRNLTHETATAWWRTAKHPKPLDPSVPLAAAHKARLQWLGATDEMLAESMEWLIENNYSTTFRDMPPLTPEQRDAERISHGWEPLNK